MKTLPAWVRFCPTLCPLKGKGQGLTLPEYRQALKGLKLTASLLSRVKKEADERQAFKDVYRSFPKFLLERFPVDTYQNRAARTEALKAYENWLLSGMNRKPDGFGECQAKTPKKAKCLPLGKRRAARLEALRK